MRPFKVFTRFLCQSLCGLHSILPLFVRGGFSGELDVMEGS